jgi:hypothetical protein
MADATTIDTRVACFWSAVNQLPDDWPLTVKAVMGHPDFRVTVETDKATAVGTITVYDPAGPHGERLGALGFQFSRGRAAGQVQRSCGDLVVLVALRIAQILGLELSDKDGNALPKGSPLDWLGMVEFDGSSEVVEELAERLSLIAQRFALSDLAQPPSDKDLPIFF